MIYHKCHNYRNWERIVFDKHSTGGLGGRVDKASDHSNPRVPSSIPKGPESNFLSSWHNLRRGGALAMLSELALS